MIEENTCNCMSQTMLQLRWVKTFRLDKELLNIRSNSLFGCSDELIMISNGGLQSLYFLKGQDKMMIFIIGKTHSWEVLE